MRNSKLRSSTAAPPLAAASRTLAPSPPGTASPSSNHFGCAVVAKVAPSSMSVLPTITSLPGDTALSGVFDVLTIVEPATAVAPSPTVKVMVACARPLVLVSSAALVLATHGVSAISASRLRGTSL